VEAKEKRGEQEETEPDGEEGVTSEVGRVAVGCGGDGALWGDRGAGLVCRLGHVWRKSVCDEGGRKYEERKRGDVVKEEEQKMRKSMKQARVSGFL